MKNKGKMRILALVLCIVVMLSNSSFIFASGETETAAAAPETTAVTPESEVSAASELAELPTPEPTAEPTEAPTPEPTAEPTPEASAAPEPTEVPTPEVSAAPEPTAEPTPEASAAPEPTEVPTPEVSAAPEPTEIPTSEPTPEASASPTPAAEQDIGSEESAAVTPTPEAEPEPDGSSEEIVLEGSCGDTTVILSGPASSFPEGTELSILVQEPAEEDQEVIEEAVEKQAEEQEMEIKSYTALDIRLLSNGEEIQPLGPVSVKFQQPEQQERTAEETSTQVLHVDESTGDATDMEAEVTEDGEVAIETTHFSIYVVVDLEQLGGQIDLTVQHWADVDELEGVDGIDGLEGPAADGSGPNKNTVAHLNYKEVFTSIYSDDTLVIDNQYGTNAENLSKIYETNKGNLRPNYELKEIWIFDEDNEVTDDPNTTDKSDDIWDKHKITDTDTITLTKDSVVRFIYEQKEYKVSEGKGLSTDATFYDWNVTADGTKNGGSHGSYNEAYWTDQGINNVHDANNYTGGSQAGNNQLAVGQQSGGVWHYRHYAVGGNSSASGGTNYLNQGNGKDADGTPRVVKNIVTGVTKDGPIYNSNIYDANLFNDTPHTGKTVTKDYNLVFNQKGDTYVLSAVVKDSGEVAQDNLETFWETSDTGGKNIFSNNFWPLDNFTYAGRDPLWGNGRQAGQSGGGDYGRYTPGKTESSGIAKSDDQQPHNWYFGMRYDFEFTIGDYTGPLNYYFRGDDDFWLFIDGELKVDLGGIHSSVGQFLDLEYLRTEQDPNKTHQVTIIYAERGGFGSCCYMEFTLPNVEPIDITTTVPKTSVTVEKQWVDHDNPERPESIEVQLLYKADDENDYQVYATQTLSKANNWKYTWTGLPKDGYSYKVKEVGETNGTNGNYTVTYQSGTYTDGTLAAGSDGSYSGKIINTASPSTWITVNKIWNDGNSSERPDKAEFYLYYRQKGSSDWIPYPNGRLTLTDNENSDTWTGKYENLPVYWGSTLTKLEYTVLEVQGDEPLGPGDKLDGKITEDLYMVTYPDGHITTGQDGTEIWKEYEALEDEETLNLKVTNSFGVNIQVKKDWKGTVPADNTNIYVGLYKDEIAQTDKYLTLNASNDWKGKFEYLPIGEGYLVKELRKTTESEKAEFMIEGAGYIGVGDGEQILFENGRTYKVSYSDLTNGAITITNQEIWQLIKRSSSETDGEPLLLSGAEFDLKHSNGTIYKGASGADGIVTWKNADGTEFTGIFPDGQYTLTETKAPTGYALGNSIDFTITNGVPASMGTDNGTVKDGILTFYYANEAIYSLPSSGSNGIYGYLFGGMLLMMAAVLIVYKTKRGEVLKRK